MLAAKMLVLSVLCWIPNQGLAQSTATAHEAKNSAAGIHYLDLGHKIPVIGPLGVPLGQLLSITGVVTPEKEKLSYKEANASMHLFTVQKVNGKALSQPIKIDVRPYSFMPVQMVANKTMTLRGYQTGAFVDFPQEAYARMVELGVAVQSSAWSFEVYFVPIEQENNPKESSR